MWLFCLFYVYMCRYNKAEQVAILSSTLDGGTYDLYNVGKEQGEQDARRGQGSYPVWVARNRFAVLDKYGAIMIKNLKNETVKKLPVTGPTPERLFFAGALKQRLFLFFFILFLFFFLFFAGVLKQHPPFSNA